MYYFDLFGKTPNIYYEGKSKKSSIVGLVFSIIYIVIYLAYFIYKMVRLGKRLDLKFYDIHSYDENYQMKFTNDNFFLIFALVDDNYEAVSDAYTVEVSYFNDEGTESSVDFEKCNLNKFSSKYKDIYKDFELDNYYCLQNINYDFTSYLQTLSIKISSSSLPTNAKAFMINFLDIELNPTYYGESVKFKNNFVYNYIYTDVGQDFYLEFQKLIVETDNNIIAFDNSRNIEKKEYLKFDKVTIFPAQSSSSSSNPIVEAEIQLADKVLLQRRKYKQLFDSLSEIGGFMQFFYILFSIIVIPISNSLYEKSVINDLFSFNLNKKEILLKNWKTGDDNKINNVNNPIVIKKKELGSESHRNLNEGDINNDNKKLNINNEQNREDHKSSDDGGSIVEHRDCKKDKIISEIKISKLFNYFTYCYKKEKKLLNIILLNEGMNLLTKKMDVLNLFRILSFEDKIEEKLHLESRQFVMSKQVKDNMKLDLTI